MKKRFGSILLLFLSISLACQLQKDLATIEPTVTEVTTSAKEPKVNLAVTEIMPTLTAPAKPIPIAGAICADPPVPSITNFHIYQTPSFPEPAARVELTDPIFGTCVVRVTDRNKDISPGDSSKGLKNEYSRVQSFNADESRILVRGLAGGWYLYDAVSLQPLGQLPIDIDPRWDAVNPDIIYYSQETRLMAYDTAAQQTKLIHEFANDFPGQQLTAVWTRYEGSPSADGRYWGYMVENQDWKTTAFLVFDLTADQVIARRAIQPSEIDSVTISPLGNYFLSYEDAFCEPGALGSETAPCGLMVYDRNLQNGRGMLRIIGHSDLALDSQGREVLVYQDIDTDNLSVLDLASGQVTALWPIDFSNTPIGLHISGRAFNRPGWAVISTHDGDAASHTWMDDQVFMIELVKGGRVIRLAHTHSVVDSNQEQDYWAEPHASANHDLTRILFTSNWGRSGTEEVEMFMIGISWAGP